MRNLMEFVANTIGYIAGALAMVAFLPQAFQSLRTKQTKDLSFTTYTLLAIQAILWIMYGFMVKSGPIIVPNVVLFIISLFILVLKRRYG